MEFYGDKLKALKKLKKITSSKLAEQLGTTRKTIHSWETGRSTPKFTDIKLICAILDIPESTISDVKSDTEESIDELAAKGKSSKELKNLRKLISSKTIPDSNIESFVNLYKQTSSNSNENIRLKKRVDRFEKILNSIDPIIYIKNANHKYTYINNSFLNIISPNFSEEEVIGVTHNELFDRLEYMPLLTLEKQVMKFGNSISNIKITIPNTSGTQTGLLNITPSFDKENHIVTEIVVTIKDITELSLSIAKQEQLKEVINAMDECVFIRKLDQPDFGYNFISNAVEKIYEYTSEEFRTNPLLWHDVILDEDKEKLKLNLDIKSLNSGSKEYRIRTKTGKIKWIHGQIFKMKDQNGEDIIFGTVKDITEQHSLEQKLLNIYHAVEQSDILVWISDMTTFDKDSEPKLIFIGDNIEQVLGIKKEIIYQESLSWLQFVHNDDLLKAKSYLLSTSYPKTVTLRIYTKGNQLKWINLRAIIKNNFRFGIAKDVTEIVERSTKDKLIRKVFEYSEAPTWLIEHSKGQDNSLKILFLNNAMGKLYNLSLEFMYKNPLYWKNYIHPDDRQRVFDKIYRTQNGAIRLKFRILLADGTTKIVSESRIISLIGNKKYIAGMMKVDQIISPDK